MACEPFATCPHAVGSAFGRRQPKCEEALDECGGTNAARPRRGGLAAHFVILVLGIIGVVALAWVGSVAFSPSEAQASPTAVCTWNGSQSGAWSNGSNWTSTSGTCTSAGGPPAGAQLVFLSSATTTSVTYDTSAGTPASSFDSISFQGTYTVAEGSGAPAAITLNPTATTGCSSATNVAVCDSGANGTSVSFAPGLDIGGDALDASGGSTLTLSGALGGSATQIIVGDVPAMTGSLVLAGTNTYTGATMLDHGTLELTNSASLGATSGVSVGAGATLDLAGSSRFTMSSTIPITSLAGALVSTNADTWAGSIVIAPAGGSLGVNGGTLFVTGSISGSGPLLLGPAGFSSGWVYLDGADTYTGATSSSGGTYVIVQNSQALGSTSSVTVDDSSLLELNTASGGPYTYDYSLTLGSGGGGTGEIEEDSASGGDTWSGSIRLASGSNGAVNAVNKIFLTGAISGSGSLDAVGSGPIVLSGANSYTGPTVSFVSELELDNPLALGATSYVKDHNGSAINLNSVTISGIAITLGDGFSGTAIIDGSGSWSGPVTLVAGSTASIFATSSSLDVQGVVGGAGPLQVGNPSYPQSTTVLSGTNTLTGTTTVLGGTLVLQSAAALGSTSSVSVSDAATLELDVPGGAQTYAEPLTLGSGTGGTATLDDATGNTWSGAITLAASSTGAFDVQKSPLSATAVISGSGALVLNGAGNAVLAGANSYSGGTTVLAGSRAVDSASTSGLGSGAVVVDSGGVLEMQGTSSVANSLTLGSGGSGGGTLLALNSTATWSGPVALASSTIDVIASGSTSSLTVGEAISGSASLRVGGTAPTAVVRLTTASSYSGSTTVSGGTVVSGHANALPAGTALDVASGGTFDLGGFNQQVSSLTGAGTVESSSGSPTLSVIDVAPAGTDTFAGALAGSLALAVQSGKWPLALSGASTFGGATEVVSGMLLIESSSALGSTSGVNVLSGAVMALSGGITVPATVSIKDLSGTLETNDSAGVDTWTGGVAPNATGSSVSASSGAVLVLSGPLSGSAPLGITGSSTNTV
ncbi:MAG: beta strand repeat-containing protein [Acidimicrobiales bacterium]